MSRPGFDPVARALPVPLAILDRHGRVVAANRRFEELAGRPAGELVGALLLGELIETAADASSRLTEALDAGHVELRLHGSFAAGAHDGGRSRRVSLRSFRHDGEPHVLAWLDELPAPGAADANAEVDEVFRRVARARHQLNNLLMGLVGQAELLLDRDDLPEDARERVEAVMRQAARLREAVQQMGAIYRR